MRNKEVGLPLVSAIVPTFNRSDLIVGAINSILKQSYPNIEVIVVDDGSTDNTGMVVAEFAKQTKQLIYVRKNNGGSASARNEGLRQATGVFIAFLDSDDRWEPNAVEALVNRLVETGSELVYSPSIEVSPSGQEEVNCPVSAGNAGMLAKAHFMMTNVRNGSYMFCRAALERVGWLDESLRYNEDSDFFQRLAIQCNSVYSPTPTVRVYNHIGSKSRNRVEIYKALLRSSQLILLQNPSFARELGIDADRRIFQIKAQLVEALAFRGDFEEANSYAKDIFSRLSLGVKIALRYKIGFLLRFEHFCRRGLRYSMKLFGK